jgi:glycerol-3-phosphate dehydrogenase
MTDDSPFDLIVIGAGINGAGIARDAAMRGLRVLLLDKGDVAGGTTSWSSRLVHGGLRYLEHGEIRLVRESLRERERLLRIASHLVRPMPLLIPVYRGGRRGRTLIRAGMIAYDLLSLDKTLPRHIDLSAADTQRLSPGLSRHGLLGAALYYDAQVEFAERLALENALDARNHGASILTYHEVDRLLTADGSVTGVGGRNILRGERFQAAAPMVVNAAGPWVDRVLATLPDDARERLIGGTKGSHIVVDPFPGAPDVAVYAEARRDGRPFFVIPWNEAFLIGATDSRYAGNLDCVVADDWEIAFLLEETNTLLPAAKLTRGHIRYSYAGVRPLPLVPHGAEANITRRHLVRDHGKSGGPRGLFSLVGGKLTTYRELAEQTVDLVQRQLGRPVTPSRTAEEPLPGARFPASWPEFREAFLAGSPLLPRASERLLRVYGARAPEVLAMATTAALRDVFDSFTGAIAAEVVWAFVKEEARTLADVLARRTMVGLGPTVGVGADVAAAGIARRALGWDAAKAEAEVAAYRRWVERYRPRALAGGPATGAPS